MSERDFTNVFNPLKTYDAAAGSLFLQEEQGLLDTIHRPHPQLWDIYKKLKKMDWDELEFLTGGSCKQEFETSSPVDYRMMINTIAWQWEADSLAAHNLMPIIGPFLSSTEAVAFYGRVADNEVLHGLTYSEIVKTSFADPDTVFKEVLLNKKALQRMTSVARVFSHAKTISGKLMTGEMSRSDPEARDALMLLICTLLCLERGQFMPSFLVTFAYGEVGRFMPIAKSVQKIAADELNIHVKGGVYIIRNELSTKEGQASMQRIRPMLQRVFKEILDSELAWTRSGLFEPGLELPGCNVDLACDVVYHAAHDITEVLMIDNPYPLVTSNPVDFLDDWLDMDKNQASPQEEKTGNYLLGGFVYTAGEKVYDVAGL